MRKYFVLLIFFVVIFIGCDDKSTQIVEGTRQIKPSTIEQPTLVTSLSKTEKKKYVYGGLSFRDPFMPTSGGKMAKAKLGITKKAVAPSLGSLNLKGIVVDEKDKVALFVSPYGSYMFVNGKLYDSQNRLVRGVSGKLISKDNDGNLNGVVLITEENYYKEFFLKDKISK